MSTTYLRESHFASLFGERRGRMSAGHRLTDEEAVWLLEHLDPREIP